MTPTAPLIFVSYSHEDREAIHLLRNQLKVIETEGHVEEWDDTKIGAGTDWFPAIKAAIEQAHTAILLISDNFLISPFILGKEVPPLLERRAHDGLRIIPVLIEPCPWEEVGWLSRMQVVTDTGEAITGTATRKKVFANIAKQIVAELRAAKTVAPTARRELVAVPPYSPGHDFFGRRRELQLLDKWAVSDKRVLLFEAIGGMGKSMLTWEWVKRHAAKVRADWAGMFWYSFYESGADMNHFAAHATAYVTGEKVESLLGQKAGALSGRLMAALQEKPWLFVLDGAERLLVEYHRFDAAQRPDDEVGEANACIVPADEDLLRQLCSEHRSKVLITSRMMPAAMLNIGGDPLPGVQHVHLTGLQPEDAEKMLTEAGIRGDSDRMRAFMKEQFDCHPLVLGMVIGLVRENLEAPGDFDHWSRRTEINFAAKDLKARKSHILELAFRNLSPEARTLMARIAIVPDTLNWVEMLALNPYMPEPPEVVKPPDSPEQDWWLSHLREMLEHVQEEERAEIEERIRARQAELKEEQRAYEAWKQSPEVRSAPEKLRHLCKDLRSRGLLQWEQGSARFDLHPVVRGFAFRFVSDDERNQAGEKVFDLFNSQEAPSYEDVRSLSELRQVLHTIRALLQMGSLDRAYDVLRNVDLASCLWFQLERYHEHLALLKPFFPERWDLPAPGLEPSAVAWLADAASSALYYSDRDAEARDPAALALDAGIRSDNSVSALLGNFILRLIGRNQLREAAALLGLDLEMDAITGEWLQADLDIELSYAMATGDFHRAEEALRKWEQAGPVHGSGAGNKASSIRSSLELRGYLDTADDASWQAGEKAISGTNERYSLRALRSEWGSWLYRQGRWAEALEKYETAVEMAREVGLFAASDEARLSACQARLGHPEPARQLLARHEGELGSLSLAEVYLALGEKEKARMHVLRAYKLAWGEGLPYANYPDLRDCRRILAELGEPEPKLPPFDPTKAGPIRFEAELRAYIDRLKQKKNNPT